jgi:hypothetical protein
MNNFQRQKISLILQHPLDILIRYFSNGNTLQPKAFNALKAKLLRWKNMENIPNPKEKFFQIDSVILYLDDSISSKESITESALSIMNNDMKINVSKVIVEHYYEIVFESQKINYSYLENYRNESKPYYTDRFSSEFLRWFINIFPGDEKKEIEKRILSVDFNGQKKIFPAINLLDDETTPKLNTDMSSRSLIDIPDDFIKRVTNERSQNKPTFAVESIDLLSGEIQCFTSSYYRALFCCDRHLYNISSLFPGLDSTNLASHKSQPYINEWMTKVKALLKNDFSVIEGSIGCSTLLVYKTDNGYETLLAKKHPDANGNSDAHVIPAGMMQPMGNNPTRFANELNIEQQVLRELSEEVFGYTENENIHPNFYWEEVSNRPPISSLKKLMNADKASLYVTGLYLDFFRLRPEILTLLIVDDESWYHSHFSAKKSIGNWEYQKGTIMAIDMNDIGFYSVIFDNVAGYLCAPGSACFVKGFEFFKKHISKK